MNPIDIARETDWTTEDSVALYLIERWGAGYFHVNEQGEIAVAPYQDERQAVSIYDIVRQAEEEGLKPPLQIRFQDILRHRVQVLNEAFRQAIEEYEYKNQYRTVYPIKVNQLREVVEEILDAGQPYGVGLEAGSKPELCAALALHEASDALIVCNGYKDQAYMETAFLGRKLGKKVILVVEKLSEVPLLIHLAKLHGVEPFVGLRIRLSTQGSGTWAGSTGDQAKFGLSTAEALAAVRRLELAGFKNCLRLLHVHIGSQVPDIMTIKSAVREVSRYYAKFRRMGYEIEYVDVGGGLAVDYDGSRSTFHSSMNYSVEEYARDVVYNIQDVCQDERVPEPCILSESGRALVAYHSVLVVNVLGSISRTGLHRTSSFQPAGHKLVTDMLEVEEELSGENLLEAWHDLVHLRQEAQKLFEVGLLELDVKASVEVLFWRIAQKIRDLFQRMDDEAPEELSQLAEQLACQQICNFSVFQSLLDYWAVGQLFPIAPIHRLNEFPSEMSTLVDITCDSDGQVNKFIDLADVAGALPLHRTESGEPYYLGVFLTGAYQDIMGDNHNLFGRVNEIHVFLDDDEESGYYIEERIEATTIGEMLNMMQYDAKELVKQMKKQIDNAIRENRLKPTEGMRLLAAFRSRLNEPTYLNFNGSLPPEE